MSYRLAAGPINHQSVYISLLRLGSCTHADAKYAFVKIWPCTWPCTCTCVSMYQLNDVPTRSFYSLRHTARWVVSVRSYPPSLDCSPGLVLGRCATSTCGGRVKSWRPNCWKTTCTTKYQHQHSSHGSGVYANNASCCIPARTHVASGHA